MNKEMIKQLEGVGFRLLELETGVIVYRLKIKGEEFSYSPKTNSFYNEYEDKCAIDEYDIPFSKILELVKEHTGVDLAPKNTKRQEIEELKMKVASLEDSISKISLSHQSDSDKFRVKLKSLQDAIESQNELIELNRKEVYRANDRLTMVLRRLKVLGVWKDEEPNKQASEMQAEEKKGFEAGDSVRISKEIIDDECCPKVAFAARHENVYKVDKVDTDGKCCLDTCYLGWFSPCYLEHAPKESPKEKALEWGDRATLIRDYQIGSSCVTVPKGQVVLIAYDVEDARAFVTTPISKVGFYIEVSLLKPL